MATRITNQDIARVFDYVQEEVGKGRVERGHELHFEDGFRVNAGGWHHREGWSRGFTVSADDPNRYYKGSVHDGGRYEGRGWHHRMADDIIAAILEGGRKVACPKCGGTGWVGKCDCDPDGYFHCKGQGSCGTRPCNHQAA